ncbi:MAG: KR domain-containing protein, partial [Halieaceae bacterium]|nr:KR domain-containing protein [Halieaceae bacterium]
GGWLLHRASESLPLDYFVCFSSMAALVGSPERAHYAAANAYLDALAAHRRALGLAASSVAWGPWAGGGMATEAALAELTRIGNHGLDPQRALRELGRVLNSAATWAAVMDIDWARFGPVIEARRPLPLIAELGPDAPGDGTAATAVDTQRLGALAREERDVALAALVRAEVARALGFDDPARIDADANYFDMGLDSLMVVQLAGELETRLGVAVGAAVYEHPSVSRLAAALSAALPEAQESAAATGDGACEADQIVGYASDLEPAIDAFQREAWPARRNAESLWRWMFLDSAKRLGRPPALWFYTEEAKVVGETGAIPVRLKVGDEECDAAWLVDSMVLQPYRERAVGTRILHRAMGDQPLALSLGQEAYMREIQLRMGWRSVGRVGHYVYPLRSRRLLRGKIPAGPLAWTAAAVLEGAAQLRRVMPAQAPAWKLEVTSVDRFGAPHDELWTRVKADIACCVVRDASYLNWKYVDREGVDFQLLEMRRGADLVAAAVVALREPDEVYRYRRGFIVDLLLPPSDRALVRGVLAALRAYFLDVGADAIHGFVACGPLEAEMKRFGFIEREADKHLLIATHREGAVDQQLLASIDSWMCLLGDSDMDAAVVAG